MGSITNANFTKKVNFTPITAPSDDHLVGKVTITLKEPPIGQPNFVVGDHIIVYKTPGTTRLDGTVTKVYGPSKYEVQLP